jgi:uncharacterized protein YbbK (DUF523 family)
MSWIKHVLEVCINVASGLPTPRPVGSSSDVSGMLDRPVEPGDDHGEDMLTPSQIVINYNYSVQEPKSRWETPTLPRLPIMPRC